MVFNSRIIKSGRIVMRLFFFHKYNLFVTMIGDMTEEVAEKYIQEEVIVNCKNKV